MAKGRGSLDQNDVSWYATRYRVAERMHLLEATATRGAAAPQGCPRTSKIAADRI